MIPLFLILGGGMLGLCVSLYIHQKKRVHTKLVCPRRFQCDRVIHSTFSETFGVKNEIGGIIFYLGVIVLAVLMIIVPVIFAAHILFEALAIAAFLGLFFSTYLLIVQAFIIRAWCAWCLLSAFATMLIALGVTVLSLV